MQVASNQLIRSSIFETQPDAVRLAGDHLIAFLPLILFIAAYRIGLGLLVGRLYGAKMKPAFGGRFSHLMNRRYWAIGFVLAIVWAIGWLSWVHVSKQA